MPIKGRENDDLVVVQKLINHQLLIVPVLIKLLVIKILKKNKILYSYTLFYL